MGIFDDNISNRKYNDAKPNYDVDDYVDIFLCDETCLGCKYMDTKLNRCLFETCILQEYPLSISYHSKFTRNCIACGNEFTRTFDYEKFENPFRYDNIQFCDKCWNNLLKLIRGE